MAASEGAVRAESSVGLLPRRSASLSPRTSQSWASKPAQIAPTPSNVALPVRPAAPPFAFRPPSVAQVRAQLEACLLEQSQRPQKPLLEQLGAGLGAATRAARSAVAPLCAKAAAFTIYQWNFAKDFVRSPKRMARAAALLATRVGTGALVFAFTGSPVLAGASSFVVGSLVDRVLPGLPSHVTRPSRGEWVLGLVTGTAVAALTANLGDHFLGLWAPQASRAFQTMPGLSALAVNQAGYHPLLRAVSNGVLGVVQRLTRFATKRVGRELLLDDAANPLQSAPASLDPR
ncbi:MAG: hypothetical protein IT371_00235 [Deltaproteobacteria bacterium]|nr:hypothetical protein [Deltaproteobacteria bacterium]